MNNRFRYLPLAALMALALVACGTNSDATTTTADEGATTTVEASTTTTTEVEAPTTTAPVEESANTIADIVAGNDDFSTLLAAVEAAGLTDALADQDATLTVFAPTNEAFEAALKGLGITADELLADKDALTAILTYHVLGDVVTSGDLGAAGSEEIPVETLSGEELIVIVGDAGNVTFRDQTANVVTTDVEAANGVIHVIDGVLLPPSD